MEVVRGSALLGRGVLPGAPCAAVGGMKLSLMAPAFTVNKRVPLSHPFLTFSNRLQHYPFCSKSSTAHITSQHLGSRSYHRLHSQSNKNPFFLCHFVPFSDRVNLPWCSQRKHCPFCPAWAFRAHQAVSSSWPNLPPPLDFHFDPQLINYQLYLNKPLPGAKLRLWKEKDPTVLIWHKFFSSFNVKPTATFHSSFWTIEHFAAHADDHRLHVTTRHMGKCWSKPNAL